MTKHLLFACVLSICVSPLPAGDWLQWRGPFFNGSTDETGLPEEWSRTENIAWSVTLPGVAASTPVISEDRVLLTGTDSARDMLQAMCLNRKTGEGTSRQCGIRSGFQVPQRHSSLPVSGSWPVKSSPPMTSNWATSPTVYGIGVENASRDSATARLGRTCRHNVLPVGGSKASR